MVGRGTGLVLEENAMACQPAFTEDWENKNPLGSRVLPALPAGCKVWMACSVRGSWTRLISRAPLEAMFLCLNLWVSPTCWFRFLCRTEQTLLKDLLNWWSGKQPHRQKLEQEAGKQAGKLLLLLCGCWLRH